SERNEMKTTSKTERYRRILLGIDNIRRKAISFSLLSKTLRKVLSGPRLRVIYNFHGFPILSLLFFLELMHVSVDFIGSGGEKETIPLGEILSKTMEYSM